MDILPWKPVEETVDAAQSTGVDADLGWRRPCPAIVQFRGKVATELGGRRQRNDQAEREQKLLNHAFPLFRSSGAPRPEIARRKSLERFSEKPGCLNECERTSIGGDVRSGSFAIVRLWRR